MQLIPTYRDLLDGRTVDDSSSLDLNIRNDPAL